MNEIRIEIKAPTGCGKSTIGMLIASSLQERGFDVALIDEDIKLNDQCTFKSWSKEEVDKRLKELSKKQIKVRVETIQVRNQ